MKLLRVKVIAAKTCGGLLDDFEIHFRTPKCNYDEFDPVCLIGPNGSGKSQFLQVLAEIMQAVIHACQPAEERREGNPDLQFEIEYLIRPEGADRPVHMRVCRTAADRRGATTLTLEEKVDTDWIPCKPTVARTRQLLPRKVVGYTSGDNETLSLPFLISRAAYAEQVGTTALKSENRSRKIPDTRLMLVDYGTHLEVLVANLLFGDEDQRKALLNDLGLEGLHSCRCIVQLAHRAAPKAPRKLREETGRKGVQLTDELEGYLTKLKACSTCHKYEEKTETYTFDFWVNDETKRGFATFWNDALDLYSSLHKLAMLNDLAIHKKTRLRFKRDTRERRFASRLPEPQDEDKIFRFERVRFNPKAQTEFVDYVSLSDGEHQLAQLLGVLCMVSFEGALFLLDEPDSHFNPQWRAKAITRIYDQPTNDGKRRPGEADGSAARQDCLLTTHAPFVPSDMKRSRVFIFYKEGGKVRFRHPDTETYGATFDSILGECFDVRPPISDVARDEINDLKSTNDPEKLQAAMSKLGHSVEKMFLAERLRNMPSKPNEE